MGEKLEKGDMSAGLFSGGVLDDMRLLAAFR
jgi:hypothetical protein